METWDTSEANLQYLLANSSESAVQYAKDNGLDVVYPKNNELFLDIDGDSEYAVFTKNLNILEQFFGKVTFVTSPSRNSTNTAPRFHVTVKLEKPVKSNFERIALQVFLGSDRTREFLGWVRAENRDAEPSIFFEKKVAQ